MRRRLGSFERAQVATGAAAPYNAVVALRLSGGVTAAGARRALARLGRRHPELVARIEGRGRRAEMVVDRDSPSLALTVVARTGEDAWRKVVQDELAHRFDPATGPLARGVL
ncbi:MAG: hypothetical protein R3325_12180, partial [Thermoanaerobaculia bacterium]|nr:hypothetical protein [Thermoanaerobaculia bacterium]